MHKRFVALAIGENLHRRGIHHGNAVMLCDFAKFIKRQCQPIVAVPYYFREVSGLPLEILADLAVRIEPEVAPIFVDMPFFVCCGVIVA